MRRTTAVCAAGMMVMGWASIASAGRIDDGLAATLFDKGPDEVVSVLVYLADRVDIKTLDAELTERRVSRRFRHEIVVRSLQEKAQATQGPIIEHLAERQRDGLVISFNAHWLSNIIYVKAIHSEILLLAQREDVDTVFADFDIELIEPVEVPEVGPPAGGPLTGDITTGVEAVRAPEVWDMGFTGAGVLVATLDTGVDGGPNGHDALRDRWRGLDERYADNPEWAWFDPVTNTDSPQSFGSSHGTHTMGSVLGGPPGEHVGVAPGAQWIHGATVDRAGGDTIEDSIPGFEWMVDPDGNPETAWDVPRSCSNSWGLSPGRGFPPCDPLFWEFLDACEAAGVLIIFSAGNEGPGETTLRRPADRATDDFRTFAVAAVDANNENWRIAGFSSRGPTFCGPNGEESIKPDISAPGVNVRSSIPGNRYTNFSGTSMASPHINGVVALMLEANPALGVDQVKQIIFDTAFDLGDEGEDNDYGWGMIDAVEAVTMALSLRSIRFEYPNGRPELIDPAGGQRMRVEVLGSEEAQPEPGTGMLHYFVDGDWVAVAMEEIEDNVYDAIFPSVPCMEELRYYVSAETTDAEEVTDPFSAPDRSFSATALIGFEDFFADNFEDDMGWTVENVDLADGAWERGVPFGSGDAAPDADFDGSGSCYITGNRVFQDVDGGPTRLITPRLDLAGRVVTVNFARYFISGSTDRMQVEISNDDGGSWTLVEDNEPDSDGWIESSFVPADFVEPTANVRVRFSVADNPNNSFCEAGVDALLIVETVCSAGGCVREPAWVCDGDVDGDAQVNPVDAGLVQSAFGSTDGQDLCNYDIDCDGQINPVDAGIVQSLFGTCEAVRAVCP